MTASTAAVSTAAPPSSLGCSSSSAWLASRDTCARCRGPGQHPLHVAGFGAVAASVPVPDRGSRPSAGVPQGRLQPWQCTIELSSPLSAARAATSALHPRTCWMSLLLWLMLGSTAPMTSAYCCTSCCGAITTNLQQRPRTAGSAAGGAAACADHNTSPTPPGASAAYTLEPSPVGCLTATMLAEAACWCCLLVQQEQRASTPSPIRHHSIAAERCNAATASAAWPRTP
jgi:hypothetical protein